MLDNPSIAVKRLSLLWLLLCLLVTNARCEPWSLALESIHGRGVQQSRQRMTCRSSGQWETFQYQHGLSGAKPEVGRTTLTGPQLETLSRILSDPEIYRLKSASSGNYKLTVNTGTRQKVIFASEPSQFPGPSRRLVETLLKWTAEKS